MQQTHDFYQAIRQDNKIISGGFSDNKAMMNAS